MAYACPVCGDPQADDEHLANHLAFTAMLHDGEHADWLDERVPDWQDRRPEGLADDVVEHAEEIDHEAETEHDHGTAPPRVEGALGRQSGPGRGAMGEETRRIVEEAVEMTERMMDPDEGGKSSGEDGDRDGESTGEAGRDGEPEDE